MPPPFSDQPRHGACGWLSKGDNKTGGREALGGAKMAKKVGGHNEIKRVPFRLDTNPFYLMYQTLSRAMEGLDEALDPHKVTFTQFRVLSNLYEQDERTITELA